MARVRKYMPPFNRLSTIEIRVEISCWAARSGGWGWGTFSEEVTFGGILRMCSRTPVGRVGRKTKELCAQKVMNRMEIKSGKQNCRG